MLKVKLQPHAVERWREYVAATKASKIASEVERHLFAALKKGVEVDHTGAIQLQLRPKLWAVVVPELTGGWAVITFHRGELLSDRRGNMPQERKDEMKDVIRRVVKALREIKYGEVVIKVQGGKVIWVDKYERERVG